MGLTVPRNKMENPEKKMDIKSLFSTKSSNSKGKMNVFQQVLLKQLNMYKDKNEPLGLPYNKHNIWPKIVKLLEENWGGYIWGLGQAKFLSKNTTSTDHKRKKKTKLASSNLEWSSHQMTPKKLRMVAIYWKKIVAIYV